MKRIPLKSGIEHDAFSVWRKYQNWRTGALKYIKNKYRRRFRQVERQMTREELKDE